MAHRCCAAAVGAARAVAQRRAVARPGAACDGVARAVAVAVVMRRDVGPAREVGVAGHGARKLRDGGARLGVGDGAEQNAASRVVEHVAVASTKGLAPGRVRAILDLLLVVVEVPRFVIVLVAAAAKVEILIAHKLCPLFPF
jgi:hypothetical protein